MPGRGPRRVYFGPPHENAVREFNAGRACLLVTTRSCTVVSNVQVGMCQEEVREFSHEPDVRATPFLRWPVADLHALDSQIVSKGIRCRGINASGGNGDVRVRSNHGRVE